jgi:hypothetical protein
MGGRYKEEVKAERSEATRELSRCGLHAVDPAAAEENLWGKHRNARIIVKMKRKIMEAMVWQDRWLISRCDVLLVLTGDTPSDGTWHEMEIAMHMGKPVVLVAPKRFSGELMGWTTVLVPKDHIYPDVQKASRFIKRTYAKDYLKHRAYFQAAIKNAKQPQTQSRKKRKSLTKASKRIKLNGGRHGRKR